MAKKDRIYDSMDDFMTDAQERFGEDWLAWRFVCPGCGYVASVQDYKDAGAPEGAVGYSCIGRYVENGRSWLNGKGDGPCDYTAGGLFNICDTAISTDGGLRYVFALAEVVDEEE